MVIMHKKFKIPLCGFDFHIYIGEEEAPRFKRAAEKYGHTNVDGFNYDRSGVCHGQYIWLREPWFATLQHEISHLLDNLYESIGCENESEFKAYLSEWIHTEVFIWWKGLGDRA